jgi:hypothetical protein
MKHSDTLAYGGVAALAAIFLLRRGASNSGGGNYSYTGGNTSTDPGPTYYPPGYTAPLPYSSSPISSAPNSYISPTPNSYIAPVAATPSGSSQTTGPSIVDTTQQGAQKQPPFPNSAAQIALAYKEANVWHDPATYGHYHKPPIGYVYVTPQNPDTLYTPPPIPLPDYQPVIPSYTKPKIPEVKVYEDDSYIPQYVTVTPSPLPIYQPIQLPEYQPVLNPYSPPAKTPDVKVYEDDVPITPATSYTPQYVTVTPSPLPTYNPVQLPEYQPYIPPYVPPPPAPVPEVKTYEDDIALPQTSYTPEYVTITPSPLAPYVPQYVAITPSPVESTYVPQYVPVTPSPIQQYVAPAPTPYVPQYMPITPSPIQPTYVPQYIAVTPSPIQQYVAPAPVQKYYDAYGNQTDQFGNQYEPAWLTNALNNGGFDTANPYGASSSNGWANTVTPYVSPSSWNSYDSYGYSGRGYYGGNIISNSGGWYGSGGNWAGFTGGGLGPAGDIGTSQCSGGGGDPYNCG